MVKGTKERSKLKALRDILFKMESALIAYSGGTDSTFLLKIAQETLKEKVAVILSSPFHSQRELTLAQGTARAIGTEPIIIAIEELKDLENDHKRCYYCKKILFSRLSRLKEEYGLNHVVEGSNLNDLDEFRPGMKALSELGIGSPLIEARFTKDEIRRLSKKMDLPTWNKPPQTCLLTRFPYYTEITKEKLLRVERAEEFLVSLGVRGAFRVRDHQDTARIEVLKRDMKIFMGERSREIIKRFKDLGYTYITLDLEGYRSGSMDQIEVKKGGRFGSKKDQKTPKGD
ncbi:TPA: ATP-dependent sacrificial sulfur transferase LarE [bacterium]|nr:ATP-dependent sacrificial sulfur transferase LarE [bacterium]